MECAFDIKTSKFELGESHMLCIEGMVIAIVRGMCASLLHTNNRGPRYQL
jgi:hypothetical protein